MSKGAFATVLTLALTMLVVGMASAQTPYIAVYFDKGLSQEAKGCPGPVLDTWYVAAVNFNMFLSGVDFAIEYPPAVAWVADLNVPPATIGYTHSGVSMGFAVPQNGYSPVGLCQVLVQWTCSECVDPFVNNPIKVVKNPGTDFLGGVDYPGFNLVPSLGLTALICPLTIPTEQTTWGQVKAVYGD